MEVGHGTGRDLTTSLLGWTMVATFRPRNLSVMIGIIISHFLQVLVIYLLPDIMARIYESFLDF
jgi:hypothetical protein